MRRPFGLTISLSIVLALLFVVVCDAQVLLDTTTADVTFNEDWDSCPPGPFPVDATFKVVIGGGTYAGTYPGWCTQKGAPTPGHSDVAPQHFDPAELWKLETSDVPEIINYLFSNLDDYLGLPDVCAWHIQWLVWDYVNTGAVVDPGDEPPGSGMATLRAALIADYPGDGNFVPSVVGTG